MSKKKHKRGSRIITIQELLSRLSTDGVVYMCIGCHEMVQNAKWVLNMKLNVVIGFLLRGRLYAVEPIK